MAALLNFVATVYAAKLYIVLFAVCAYGLRSYISYRRLAHIQGPVLAAWSNFWLARVVHNSKTHEDFYQVNMKYGVLLFSLDHHVTRAYYSPALGSLARIGPNILVSSDPDIMRRMSSARSTYTKSNWYEGLRMQPGHNNVFSTVDEKDHAQRRARLAMGVRKLPYLFLEVPDKR
jgi:hypothetical protein